MKHTIKALTFRIMITGLLVVILLNPGLLYANITIHTNYRIFLNKQIDKHLKLHLDKAKQLLTASELYDPNLLIDICLNDESFYSVINEKIHGQSFGPSFYYQC